MAYPATSTEDRFFKYVEGRFSPDCWIWSGGKNPGGYGRIHEPRRSGSVILAHRFSFEFHKHKLLPGEQLHHVCRNRSCVNPDHLQVVTIENHPDAGNVINKNKTHCIHGHELSPENTYSYVDKRCVQKRCCRKCRYEVSRKNNQINREQINIARRIRRAEQKRVRKETRT